MKKTVKLETGNLQFLANMLPLLAKLRFSLPVKMCIHQTRRIIEEFNKDLTTELQEAIPEDIKKLQKQLQSGERLPDAKKKKIETEIQEKITVWEKTDEFKNQFDVSHEIEISIIPFNILPATIHMQDIGVGTIISPPKFEDDEKINPLMGRKVTAAEKAKRWPNDMSEQLENCLSLITEMPD